VCLVGIVTAHASRPAILELFGINYWSYPDEDRAVRLADEKIAKNRKDYPWLVEKIKKPEFADIISEADPNSGTEFYYVHYAGLTKAAQSEMFCEYGMEGDGTKKPVTDAIDNFLELEMKDAETPEDKEANAEKKKLIIGINKVDTAFKDLVQTYLSKIIQIA